MKVITRGVIDWRTFEILEEDAYQYEGPIAEAKSGGGAPQPVDPYQQAAAQYGLNTGTATFNAGLNRTNQTNPLGSSTWDVTGYSNAGVGTPSGSSPSVPGISPGPGGSGYGPYSLGGTGVNPGLPMGLGAGAPQYTETTQLAPQFQSVLQQPIDTSNVPGMPGGPNLSSTIGSAENATWGQEMNFLQPQEQLQTEQLNSQLAAEGNMPGSAASDNAKNLLANQQSLENTQAANQAVTTGLGELPMLYGLGSTDLQNQLAERGGLISEYNALTPGSGAAAYASPTDITGPFGQQYQGALAAYNANTATQNANTDAGAGLLSSYLMYLALAG